jgi:hypothetical protein
MDRLERELIFVGTVEVVGQRPERWSGGLGAYQTVRFRVDETISGLAPGPEIAVRYPVVKGSMTAEPGEVPCLSKRLFGVGARLLVMAIEDRATMQHVASEHFGALPYSLLLAQRMRDAATGVEPAPRAAAAPPSSSNGRFRSSD